ncbi:MAG: hypothetical protein NVS3B19_05130 [Ginsengibacter sp.]
MLVLYKPHIEYLKEHAVDPDKRKSVVKGESSRHFIDIDHYGINPYPDLPRNWKEALLIYSEDTITKYGTVPWTIERVMFNLTESFKEKNLSKILKNSADIGHYVADSHVPLHCNTNHNGQLTNQNGIHGLWESRIPELLADKKFNFFLGSAKYITNLKYFIWERVLESALLSDSVLFIERQLSKQMGPFEKYSYEKRNKKLVKVYSALYTIRFNQLMNNMVERRMQKSVESIASLWFTAWVNAGQPNLEEVSKQKLSEEDQLQINELNMTWKKYNYQPENDCIK